MFGKHRRRDPRDKGMAEQRANLSLRGAKGGDEWHRFRSLPDGLLRLVVRPFARRIGFRSGRQRVEVGKGFAGAVFGVFDPGQPCEGAVGPGGGGVAEA